MVKIIFEPMAIHVFSNISNLNSHEVARRQCVLSSWLEMALITVRKQSTLVYFFSVVYSAVEYLIIYVFTCLNNTSECLVQQF